MDKEMYSKLKGLPSFEEMDMYFEVSSVDDECSFPVREIRRKVIEMISLYSKIVEELLHPDSGSAMHEVSQFSDKEKETHLTLYKKLKKFERMGLDVALTFDEAQQAAYVSEVFASWKGIVGELQGISVKLVSAWDLDVSTKKDNGYFG